jgi:tetratricopeptide repeat protein
MKYLLYCLLSFCSVAFAANPLKPVHALLKAGRPLDALNAAKRLMADSALRDEPKLYALGMEAAVAANSVENEKIYLHKAYDTLSFFQTTYDFFNCARRYDALTQKSSNKKLSKQLHDFYPNLLAGGLFMYEHKQYAEAIKLLQMADEVLDLPLWLQLQPTLPQQQRELIRNILIRSAFQEKKYDLVLHFTTDSIQNAAFRRMAIEYRARTNSALGETNAYVKDLKVGISDAGNYPYFFTHLYDYYLQQNQADAALRLSDSLLTVYPLQSPNRLPQPTAADTSFYLTLLSAKALAQINLHAYKEAIKTCQTYRAVDSTNVEIDFYFGTAYSNAAAAVDLPTSINSAAYKSAQAERRKLYVKAVPYLERYRKARPNEAKSWGPLLYNAYLSLNQGKKFAEMEKLLKAKLFSR